MKYCPSRSKYRFSQKNFTPGIAVFLVKLRKLRCQNFRSMIKIGKYNRMRVVKLLDFGAYLVDCEGDDPREILLPQRYIPEGLATEDTIDVFVYNDSEDRLIATTEKPFAQVGEFAFLEVVQVNDTGAFLDWGLPKNLLVPYSEQKVRMKRGGIYPVYVYLDHATMRVVASAKIEKHLGNTVPEYKAGQEVNALVLSHGELGFRCIVDNLHAGMIYSNELFRPLEIGEQCRAFVRRVREDGKIDLTLSPEIHERMDVLGRKILDYLHRNTRAEAAISEKMDPEEIKARFACSKKDFKKALGALYKARKIAIDKSTGKISLSE